MMLPCLKFLWVQIWLESTKTDGSQFPVLKDELGLKLTIAKRCPDVDFECVFCYLLSRSCKSEGSGSLLASVAFYMKILQPNVIILTLTCGRYTVLSTLTVSSDSLCYRCHTCGWDRASFPGNPGINWLNFDFPNPKIFQSHILPIFDFFQGKVGPFIRYWKMVSKLWLCHKHDQDSTRQTFRLAGTKSGILFVSEALGWIPD